MFETAALLTAVLFGQVDGMYMAGSSVVQNRSIAVDKTPDYSSNSDVELYLDNNFATHYFANLTDNFGQNDEGTCSFVAAQMLLTYFDTYWDDNIVDDSYITKTIVAGEDSGDFIGIESPGGTPDPLYAKSGTADNYLKFVQSYAGVSLHYYLISLANDLFDDYGDTEYSLSVSRTSQLISHYLRDKRGYSSADFTLEYRSYNSDRNIDDWVIDNIRNGTPVFTAVTYSTSYHAAVAYDYEEESGEIYFHTGWHSDARTYEHYSYSELKVDQIKEAFVLDFNSDHRHSGNYLYVDLNGDLSDYCICYSVVPWNIRVENYYLDQLPTYVWTALRGDWYKNLTYRVAFLTLSGYERLVVSRVSGLSLRLNTTQFTSVLSIPTSAYKIYISLERNGVDFLDDLYFVRQIDDPISYHRFTQVIPSDWGFDSRYWFENEGIRTTTLNVDGLSIGTSRLRCGYIEKKYVILSPRRENAGEAYLELTFDRRVYYFGYSALWWSAKEDAISADIYVRDTTGKWIESIDLMSMGLPEGGVNPRRELLFFSSGITGVRFEATAAASGDRNKGRLCIDDLLFSTSSAAYDHYFADYRSTYLDR